VPPTLQNLTKKLVNLCLSKKHVLGYFSRVHARHPKRLYIDVWAQFIRVDTRGLAQGIDILGRNPLPMGNSLRGYAKIIRQLFGRAKVPEHVVEGWVSVHSHDGTINSSI